MNRPIRQGPPAGLGATVQIFLFVVLPLALLLLGVAFGSLQLHHQAMRAMIGDRDLRAARFAASSLGKEISHQGSVLRSLADDLPAQAGAPDLAGLHAGHAASFSSGLALFTPDGRLVTAHGDPATWQVLPGQPAQHVLTGLIETVRRDTNQGYALIPPGAAPGGPLLLVAVSTASGQVLVGAQPVQPLLAGNLSELGAGEHLSAWVVAPGGTVIYQAGRLAPEAPLASHSGSQNALAGESGLDYVQTPSGEHVVAFSPITPSGWGLVVEEAWEQAAGPLLSTTQAAPLVLAPLLVLILLGLWFGLRQIVQPIQRLENQAAALAEGDFEAIEKPVGGVAEIRRLQEQLKGMAIRLADAQASLHNYIGALTAGVEAERRSLARDLHDDTLQALIALNQRLQLASTQLPDSHLEGSQDMAQQAIVNLRRTVRGLRPIYLEDLGLGTSLEMLAGEIGQAGARVEFTLDGDERRLPSEVELAYYRIAQEALSNALRHAGATRTRVSLRYDPVWVRMEIDDDGCGFRLPETAGDFARSGHYGLLGMHERAELAGARLVIRSQPGRGTTISLQFTG